MAVTMKGSPMKESSSSRRSFMAATQRDVKVAGTTRDRSRSGEQEVVTEGRGQGAQTDG